MEAHRQMHFYEFEFLDAKRNHSSKVCQRTMVIKKTCGGEYIPPSKIAVPFKKQRVTTGQLAKPLIIWGSEL